jgi:hypothetical protein
VLARNHGAARQRCSPAHGFDLQSQVLKADVLSRFTVRSNCSEKMRSRSWPR